MWVRGCPWESVSGGLPPLCRSHRLLGLFQNRLGLGGALAGVVGEALGLFEALAQLLGGALGLLGLAAEEVGAAGGLLALGLGVGQPLALPRLLLLLALAGLLLSGFGVLLVAEAILKRIGLLP